jgi:DNA-binding response OmpR family regulator
MAADVVVVRWPEEREAASQLAHAGAALLYLVAGDDDPPIPTSCLEDWVRVPGDERDLRARVAALELRAAAHTGPPWVADNGLLHYRGKSVHLSPVESGLAEALTAEFSEVVPDQVLIERAATAAGTLGSLRAEIARLRSRVRPVDLSIRRVTNRGYRMHTR